MMRPATVCDTMVTNLEMIDEENYHQQYLAQEKVNTPL